MKKLSPPPRMTDRLPVFAAVVAILAVVLLAASGIGTRAGAWHFRTGFTILKAATYCGIAAALLAVAALATAGKTRQRVGIVVAILALALAGFACGLPISWMMKAKRLPRIHDISTDLNSPPPFIATAQARGDRSSLPPAEVTALQRQAYPDLHTLILPLPHDRAFAKALATARDMGWHIVANVPAQGRIEATDTTFWFGFEDDIVVRITPEGERSRVDVRSASRVGISDVGTNAARIRRYLHKLAAE